MTTDDRRAATILVVDDIEDNLVLLEEYLEEEVWSVHRACSGREAIRIVEEVGPDIILLDLMMPEFNGLAVLRAIRSMNTLNDTSVIMQTAHADKENVITAQRLGCNYFLCKPLNKERLLAEVDACLKSRAVSQTARTSRAEGPIPAIAAGELGATITEATNLLKAGQLAIRSDAIEAPDCFQNLIPATSVIGKQLMSLANSPAHGGRHPVRTVAEAIIRIGTHNTSRLIQKASRRATAGINATQIGKVLGFIDTISAVFPDRTSTTEGMLALLEELNNASQVNKDIESNSSPAVDET